MDKKISQKVSYIILGLVSIVVLILILNFDRGLEGENAITSQPISTSYTPPEAINVGTTSTSEINPFTAGPRDPNTSNIVGYFAGGSFDWYVPDWAVQNWKVANLQTNQGFDISYATSSTETEENFSDIVFNVGSTTEIFNADTLFDDAQKGILPQNTEFNYQSGPVVSSETLINDDTNDRYYHVVMDIGDRFADYYFLDGYQKTVIISFSAGKESFYNYEPYIKALVQGIIGVRPLQG